jgi:hypothetical protein
MVPSPCSASAHMLGKVLDHVGEIGNHRSRRRSLRCSPRRADPWLRHGPAGAGQTPRTTHRTTRPPPPPALCPATSCGVRRSAARRACQFSTFGSLSRSVSQCSSASLPVVWRHPRVLMRRGSPGPACAPSPPAMRSGAATIPSQAGDFLTTSFVPTIEIDVSSTRPSSGPHGRYTMHFVGG